MNSIKLNISPDKLSAYLTVSTGPENFPSSEAILSYLTKNNILYGIDSSLISALCVKKEPVRSIRIAQGKEPIGKLKWHVVVDNPHKPTITSTNRADFKKLASYQFVEKGTQIVSRDESVVPLPGKTVTGEQIEIDAHDLDFPEFENLSLSEDKKILSASSTGYIRWADNKLIIEEVLHIKGNVDYSTGNLKLKGAVIIDGDVRSGFKVETAGRISIGGSVDAADLFSQDGDITIGQGILGQGRAKILCGGTLRCGFMQDANIAVQKDVIIEKYALNCVISSGGYVRAGKKNSLIRGGILTAEKGIELYDVGSERGTPTELKIRNYSDGDSQSQLWKLNREKSSYRLRLSSLKKRQDFLLILKRGTENLSNEKMAELAFIEKEMARLKVKLETLTGDEGRLQKESSIQTIKKEILIYGTMHKNVRVDIGGAHFICPFTKMNARLTNFKEEIIIESLRAQSSPEYDIYVPKD